MSVAAPPRHFAARCFVAPLADFEQFVRVAKPGEQMTIAHGLEPPRSEAVWLKSIDYVAAGLIVVRHVRSRLGYDYVATRCARVFDAQDDLPLFGLGSRARNAVDHETEDSVLQFVARIARRGAPLPSNADIARECGLRSADAARYRLRRLQERGLIQIESNSPDPSVPRSVRLRGSLRMKGSDMKVGRYK